MTPPLKPCSPTCIENAEIDARSENVYRKRANPIHVARALQAMQSASASIARARAILRTFRESLDEQRRRSMPAPVSAPAAPAVGEPTPPDVLDVAADCFREILTLLDTPRDEWTRNTLSDAGVAALRGLLRVGVHGPAFRSSLEEARKERQAWRELAEHLDGCVECSQMSVETCSDGLPLRNIARWLTCNGSARATWRDHAATVLAVDDGYATVVVDGYEASNVTHLSALVIDYPAGRTAP